jgi:hypothetical protein
VERAGTILIDVWKQFFQHDPGPKKAGFFAAA